jgi:hypothetical protein
MPSDAYQADRGKIQTVRWLAFFLALAVAFTAAPALVHLNLAGAPGWTWVVLLLASVQACYVFWMVVTPDWASVRVVMFVFLAVATVYGIATAVAMTTPPGDPMPLDVGELHASAPRWCASVVLVSFLAVYLCGRTSRRWRRSFELEMWGRRRSARSVSTWIAN